MLKQFKFSTWFFLAVVLICPFFIFVQKEDNVNLENRRKAERPTKLSWTYPREFDAYYQDHFPFRSYLIRKFYTVRKSIKDNPKVIVGEGDWLFINSSPFDTYAKVDNSLGDYTGKTLLDEEDLEKFRNKLKVQKEYYDKMGTKFIVMIPPNKMSVYDELLPKAYQKLKAEETLYDQAAQAAKDAGVPYINLKEALRDARSNAPTYYRTDTHWNDYGAYVAFQKLAEVLNIKVPPILSIKTELSQCGDNFRMSGGSGKCFDIQHYPIVSFNSKEATCTRRSNDGYIFCSNETAPYKEHIFLGRDSFTEKLAPFLTKTFQKVTLLWSGRLNDEEFFKIVEEEKPDIMIYNFAERNLLQIGKVPPKSKEDNKE